MREYKIEPVTLYRVVLREKDLKPSDLGTFDTEEKAKTFIERWKEHDAIMEEFS